MKEYMKRLALTLDETDVSGLSKWPDVLLMSTRVFVAGNGGSAAIASHFVVDLLKTINKPISAISLVDNVPVLTAIGNDVGYDEVFSRQLSYHFASPMDALILISSSGNSPNVARAALYAQDFKMSLLTLSGFQPMNKIRTIGEVVSPAHQVWVNSNDYGIVEDVHHACMHAVVDAMK